jgi:dTDP-4-amino-4,6-dideoxygalactose transaminase
MDKIRKIPFAKIHISKVERELVNEVLDSGWLTTAGKTLEFEKRFSEYIDVPYACAVNSCTAALHLGLEALEVKANDEVFVPSMTFTASAEIIRYLDAHPVFLDTEYRTNLITPEILKEAINKHPNVKTLVIVHFSGQAANMTGIKNICDKHGIKILEDAAHAFPTKHDGKFIGNFGDVTCFSFYANKTITTGEGGMLVTSNEEIYKRVKIMRLHGINRDIWDRFNSNKPSWEYDVVEAGFKYNMPDLSAAVGLGQLEQAELFRGERQKAVEWYYEELKNLPMLDLPICHDRIEDHSWHLFLLILNKKSKISRNEFIEKLAEFGIGTSVHYKPLHQMTYYKEKYSLKKEDYPLAEKTWQGNVSLPLYPFMEYEDVKYVCDKIKILLN